jgi:hypothetical protein
MRSTPKILCLLVGLTILASCSADSPTGPAGPEGDKSGSTVINDYIVRYLGRSFDESGDTTTFRYTIQGRGVGPALDLFALELPACLPMLDSWSPADGASYDAENPVEIAWDLPIQPYGTSGIQYAVTLPGDIPEGLVQGTVEAGGDSQVRAIPGPACPEYEIAGAVFIDADAEGDRDPDELGIADVAVELVHPDQTVTVLVTDIDGNFSTLVGEGSYTLRIDLEAYPEAFNAQLAASFDATLPLEIAVTVGPDATDNLFGFAPRTEQIIAELESGELASNGWSAKFWRQQLEWALTDPDHPEAEFDREELLAFLAEIQELYLAEIFQFTPGSELQEAYDILERQVRTPGDAQSLQRSLARQLLATEFNEVSGRGLVDDPELQGVLLAWGETVWVENQELLRRLATSQDQDPQNVWAALSELIPPALQIFTLINTGGGGGVDE